MKSYRLGLLAIVSIVVFSCTTMRSTLPAVENSAPRTDAPAWIKQGNIYEVNVRQYTPEGTLNAFAKHLDRLKDMGVQTLWFMPIQPISVTDRKGTLGSYYAIADYTAINPEFGTMDDWKRLVKLTHDKGMKVIIDWVANHTGADHRWLQTNPGFHVRDSAGVAMIAADWTDVRKLNYASREMRDSMIASMLFWVKETGIDGFRCDVAADVPADFWQECIADLLKEKHVFMLAESDRPAMHEAGFHASYAWPMFHKMNQIAAGKLPAHALDSVLLHNDTAFPAKAMYMYFTSNHDENSWNNADYGTMPGAVHAPFAVFSQTAKASVPLIYSGQEEPVLRAIQFFEKDPFGFEKYERAPFYKALLQLRSTNIALATDASFTRLSAGNPAAVYAYLREKNGQRVLVVLNLSAKPERVEIREPATFGTPRNIFSGDAEMLNASWWVLEPWGYRVFEY